jgi:hypothetical protein
MELTVDANGQASVPMTISPSLFVWIAGDFTTGKYATTPDSRTPSTRVTMSYSSDGTTISMYRPSMDFCIFRPGVGAWTGFQVDGRDGDLDPRPGYLTFAISKLQPVANDPPAPLNLQKGDVIFAFESLNLPEYYITPVLTNAVIPTATSVSSIPNPSLPGSSTTFITSVTPMASSPAPTGAVTLFVDGAAALSTPLANGRATITVDPLPIGSHSVFAQYTPAPGSIFRESLSPVLTQVVQPSRRRSARH